MTAIYLIEQQSLKLKTEAKKWKPFIKILFLLWLFTCLYLLVNYKSVQAYFLMTSRTGPNSIEDLMEKGFQLRVTILMPYSVQTLIYFLRFQIHIDDFFNIKRHCQYVTSKSCSNLLEKVVLYTTYVCNTIKVVLSDQVALIQEEGSLKYWV